MDYIKEEKSETTTQSPWVARQTLKVGVALYPYVRPLLPYLLPAPSRHFPPEAYLPCEDEYVGKFWNLFQKDGKGLDKTICEAGAHALTVKEGISAWPFLSKSAVLVTQPDHIKAIIKDNLSKICMHDSTGSFKLFFGENTIFNSPHGTPQWKTLRARFLNVLFAGKALKNDVSTMQALISKHLATITAQNGTITDLETFANSFTIDMIGATKLGLATISEEAKKNISNIISEAVVEVANPFDQLMSEYVPGYKYLVDNKIFYTYVTGSKLHPLVEKGHQLIREGLIKPNEKNILSTTNWLYPPVEDDPKSPSFWDRCSRKEKFNLYSKKNVQEISQFLVVGQETTAKLVMTSTLLLADSNHTAILEKVRAEIAAQTLPPEEWTGENLPNLPFLDAVLNEALRLYPPIPDMLFKIMTPFTIDNLKFEKDTYAVISQRMTHRLKSTWGQDADEFNPARFLNPDRTYKPHEFFPFGFMPRECAGQLFSRLEVKLWLARLVQAFNLQCELHHPYPFHQIFTMRLDLKNIHLQCTPREKVEMTPFFHK